MPRPWSRTYFLRWLLLAPPGMNIRNDLAHGFTSGISPVYAALILRAAAMLITVTAPQSPSAARVAAADQPADLVPLPRRDRDDILGLLSHPVSSPVPAPWRDGLSGRATPGDSDVAHRGLADVCALPIPGRACAARQCLGRRG
jgi:hypothetical protein